MGTIFDARIELSSPARLPADRFVDLARGLVAEGILALPGAVIADARPNFDPFLFDSARLKQGRVVYEGEDLEALLAALASVYDAHDVAVYFAGLDPEHPDYGSLCCGAWQTESALHALREPARIAAVGGVRGDFAYDEEYEGERIEPPPAELVGVLHALSIGGKNAPILPEEIEESYLARFFADRGVPVGTIAIGAS